jgi:hypothetical protein
MLELTKNPPSNFDEMVADMLKCEQTKGQSVYAHGQSVCEYYVELMDHLKGLYSIYKSNWRLPDWLDAYRQEILDNLWEDERIQTYALYHDNGKPYVRTVDKKTGEVHFPNHAAASEYIWACVGGNQIVGHLIGQDMLIHTGSAEDIQEYIDHADIKSAITLLIVALCEIHSNARLFGGIESTSFKSKWKKLDRRGRQILKYYFGEKSSVSD